MKCRIDQEKRAAHHRCINLFPDVFEKGDNNKARVKYVEVPDEFELDAQSASNSCPAGAIIIEF